jgi:hypothetical protein
MAELLDGWVEGPTWAAPLNNRQLTALLLVMHAARKYHLCSNLSGFVSAQ